MEETIKVDEHKHIGPYPNIGEHGPVMFIQKFGKDKSITEDLWICLDCGWATDDNRTFHHEDCDREDNPVNTTWREHLEIRDYPE